MITEESWQKIKDGDIYLDFKSKDELNKPIRESQHFLLKDVVGGWKYPCNLFITLIPEKNIPENEFSEREGRIEIQFTEKSAKRLFDSLRQYLTDHEYNKERAKKHEEEWDKKQLEKNTKIITFVDIMENVS